LKGVGQVGEGGEKLVELGLLPMKALYHGRYRGKTRLR
jgi:hypothetical protein